MTEILVPAVVSGVDAGDLWGGQATVTERFSERAEEVADALADVSKTLQSRLEQRLSATGGALMVSEVQLSFSLELKAESGVLLAKASAGGTFTATITWARRSQVRMGATE
jgi:cytochrome b